MYSNAIGEFEVKLVSLNPDGTAVVRLHCRALLGNTQEKEFFDKTRKGPGGVGEVVDVLVFRGEILLELKKQDGTAIGNEAEAKELTRRFMAAVETVAEELDAFDLLRLRESDFNPMAIGSDD